MKDNINCVTGDVASDFYHRYEEDIKILSPKGDKMHIDFLWHGHELFQMEKQMSQAGIDFYNRVIDTCEKYYNVEPFVTLYHYDMPIEYFKNGGWENKKQLKRLLNMQRICFKYFGHRVKYWATVMSLTMKHIVVMVKLSSKCEKFVS